MNKCLCLLLSLLLSSCASLPSASPTPPGPQLSWSERQQKLEKINNWSLKGAIAIHAPQDSGSASLTWQQNAQNYSISLLGPFGSSAIQINGAPGKVTLQNAEGKTFSASTPEQLLYSQTGWQLPISNLFYWARGLPVPSLSAQRQLDSHNRLTQLVQGEWRVEFKAYSVFGQNELPTKIVMSHPKLNIKIVVYQWLV